MMGFDPDTITQAKLHELRRAAEHAWSDETRHEDSRGHPQPSAGQCYVTSRWLQSKLGGYIGVKQGHYFWVSHDRKYIIDLTGDQNASGPVRWAAQMQDGEDEPFEFESEQMRHRPGPIIYTQATNPLYKGFRMKDYPNPHPRSELFAERANAALAGNLTKQADGAAGSDVYPGQGPQAEEEFNKRYFHDPVIDDLNLSMEPPVEREYQFVFANGEFKVSPVDDHSTMLSETGASPNHNGPTAVGYINVKGRNALWSVESNIGLRGLVKMMKDYSKQVGWDWGGLVDGSGQPVHEDYAGKTAYYYGWRDGDLLISERPFWPHTGRIEVGNGIASFEKPPNPFAREGLEEWAKDFGYRIAEYPGGGDIENRMTPMDDKIKSKEWLQQYDKGNPEAEPGKEFEGEPHGELICPICGEQQPNFKEYVLHTKGHQDPTMQPIDDGHFPTIEPLDEPLGLRPTQSQPTAIPLSSVQINPWKFAPEGWRFASETATQKLQRKERLEQTLGPDQTNVVHEWPNGWKMHEINNYADMEREGRMMGNCFGLYTSDNPHEVWGEHPECDFFWDDEGSVDEGSVERPGEPGAEDIHNYNIPLPQHHQGMFFSLRDPDGLPHASGDLKKEEMGGDIFDEGAWLGRHNTTPKLQHQELIEDWLHKEYGREPEPRMSEEEARQWRLQEMRGASWHFAAGGKEGKDFLQAPIPFIYDIEQDFITVGKPGMQTPEIQGQFTPGGLVEGYYEPKGKMVINTTTTIPFSTFHMMQLFYFSHPGLEITSLEIENQKGERHKVA
jgi:hypothetical protein